MKRRLPPALPRPGVERRPTGAFGWLEAQLLHDGWLAEIGPHATATLVLLALAADRRGGSFFSRDRMAIALGMTRHETDMALQRLLDSGLVEHRPWRSGAIDGVWQLVMPARRHQRKRTAATLTAAEVLRSLGFHNRERT